MRRSMTFALLSLFLAAPLAVQAESHNPADYPLRIHIYRRTETNFYQNRSMEEAKGEGRANLFEAGQPKGLDFEFACDQRLQTSSGFETFPAKWKKPGAELVVLQPEFGKQGSYGTCRLKVMVKDFVYVTHNGTLMSEPSDVFKKWMVKHEYDPEHGKDTPIRAAGDAQPATAPSPAPATTPAPQ